MTFDKGQKSPRCTVKGQSGISREGFSGELRHTSAGSVTGIFDPHLATTGRSVLSLEILLSPPWLQICNSSSWQFPAVVLSHLTSQAARSTLCMGTLSQGTWGPSGGLHVLWMLTHALLVLRAMHLQPRCVSRSQQVNHAWVSSPTSQGLTTSTAELELFVPDGT